VAVTISLYNHTSKRFAEGSNAATDTYKLKLLTAATFDPTHTTLAATGGTETASGTGYTAGGPSLANVTVTTVTTNDAKFDADDVVLTASGGAITANCGIVYNSSDANSPPVAFIDFGETKIAGDGTDFKVIWNVNGIINFTVA
jgi:hypothetical protein